jgi:hypothetical protein
MNKLNQDTKTEIVFKLLMHWQKEPLKTFSKITNAPDLPIEMKDLNLQQFLSMVFKDQQHISPVIKDLTETEWSEKVLNICK